MKQNNPGMDVKFQGRYMVGMILQFVWQCPKCHAMVPLTVFDLGSDQYCKHCFQENDLEQRMFLRRTQML